MRDDVHIPPVVRGPRRRQPGDTVSEVNDDLTVYILGGRRWSSTSFLLHHLTSVFQSPGAEVEPPDSGPRLWGCSWIVFPVEPACSPAGHGGLLQMSADGPKSRAWEKGSACRETWCQTWGMSSHIHKAGHKTSLILISIWKTEIIRYLSKAAVTISNIAFKAFSLVGSDCYNLGQIPACMSLLENHITKYGCSERMLDPTG